MSNSQLVNGGGLGACMNLLNITDKAPYKRPCIPKRSAILQIFSNSFACKLLCKNAWHYLNLAKGELGHGQFSSVFFACSDTRLHTFTSTPKDTNKHQTLSSRTCNTAFTWEPLTSVSVRGYQGNMACIIQQISLVWLWASAWMCPSEYIRVTNTPSADKSCIRLDMQSCEWSIRLGASWKCTRWDVLLGCVFCESIFTARSVLMFSSVKK